MKTVYETTLWWTNPESKGEPYFTTSSADMSVEGWVKIQTISIDLRTAVEALRSQVSDIRNKSDEKVNALMDRIAALEGKGDGK